MFKDKVVLITGGSSGIGAVTALLFAQNGADVAITYQKNKEGARDVVESIEKLGRKAVAIKANLIKEKQAKNTATFTLKTFGKIDILVNNAGRYIHGDEWDGLSKIWMKSIEQNLVSMFNVSKYTVEQFQKQQSGIMINIASRHGINGHADAIAYSAAKAGVINMTQSYAEILADFGRANCVSPSATNAGYWLTAPKEEIESLLKNRPNQKFIEPKTIAEKILFLASDEARDINGQNFAITE